MEKLFTEFILNEKVLALTTTTKLGNLAYQVDDGKGVFENRKKLCDILNIDTNQLILTHQSHSSVIKEVTSFDKGKGEHSFESGIDADGFYTKSKDIAIGIFHADCVPIFFYDKAKDIIGIIHSGFKGTIKHACKSMLLTYFEEQYASIDEISFVIGPSRRTESFEIDDDTFSLIKEAKLEKYVIQSRFDMVSAIIDDLISLGDKKEQIFDSHIYNVKNEIYYSAYKKKPVGRMASLIKFK